MDTGWITTWRLILEFQTPGHFDKSPEAIIKATLGATLLDLHCPYGLVRGDEPPCTPCPQRQQCPYPVVFKPTAIVDTVGRPPPPPFTLRYLGPVQPDIGSRAQIDLTLVGPARSHIHHLTDALRRAAARGFGAREARARAEVIDITQRPPAQIIEASDGVLLRLETPVIIREWGAQHRDTLRHFDPLAFGRALVRRLRDLSSSYGDCGLALPDADRALEVRHDRTRTSMRRAFSARQDQTIYAEGVVGEVEVGGSALAAWLPALALGERLGVGRFTTWGNGRFSVWSMDMGETK
jgi:hypothetical protein